MKRPVSSAICWNVIVLIALALNGISCKDRENLRTLKETSDRANQSYKQYRTGDYATAKAALLDFIRYLEEQMRDPSYAHIEAAKSDIMTAYVRLAKLEEKNNGAEKESYMQQAVARCQQLKIKGDCSPQTLRKRIDDFDALPMK